MQKIHDKKLKCKATALKRQLQPKVIFIRGNFTKNQKLRLKINPSNRFKERNTENKNFGEYKFMKNVSNVNIALWDKKS